MKLVLTRSYGIYLNAYNSRPDLLLKETYDSRDQSMRINPA